VAIGEYDPAFSITSLVVVALATVATVILLRRGLSLRLPSITDAIPASGTYAERVRAYAVVAVTCAGIFALGFGAWLAALEVRGRLRKSSAPKIVVSDDRGLVDEIPKILESASKMRGTVAVLVAAVALLLGSLWAVGQTPDPRSTTPSTTSTTTATATARAENLPTSSLP
jgi:hypothetical protein